MSEELKKKLAEMEKAGANLERASLRFKESMDELEGALRRRGSKSIPPPMKRSRSSASLRAKKT